MCQLPPVHGWKLKLVDAATVLILRQEDSKPVKPMLSVWFILDVMCHLTVVFLWIWSVASAGNLLTMILTYY
ncbi:Uncharacterised protein [Escherichia coli]|nr:Uncharacterised protein [Escherichia coli]